MPKQTQKSKLIVYGDIAVDVTIRTAVTSPATGGKVADTQIYILPGGSAANCAVVAARLGVPVEFVGVTGSDYLARMLIDDMCASGVDIRHLRQTAEPTGVIATMIHPGGERTFYSFRGAAISAQYGPIPADLIQPGDFLHLSGYSFQDEPSRETAYRLIAQAKETGAAVSLDPSFHSDQDFRDKLLPVMDDVDIVFPNGEEARRITGESTVERAAAVIQSLGPQTVAVKLGDAGCHLTTPHGSVHVPAYPVREVIDTTGAGDAFCGGFLVGRLWGWEASDAVRLGHAAAARVIAHRGGHTGAPGPAEMRQHLTEWGDPELTSAILETPHLSGE